jgi:general secretion pathway protein A
MMMKKTIGRMTPHDLNTLGFKEDPFSSSADPRFLYLSRNHQYILDRLQDLVEWREGLAVVDGARGTGKTSLARRLFHITETDDSIHSVYIHTAAFKTSMDAARDIAAAFGLRGRRSYLDQIRDLEVFLVELKRQDKTAVVLLDDAENMQPDSLEAIQNMMNFDLSAKLIQVILFGRQELKETFLHKKALLDRVVVWLNIGPLPFPEMVRMISFRLTVAGRNKPLFTDSAITRLYDFSSGFPRPLVLVCREVVRVLIDEQKDVADISEVEKAIDVYEERSRRPNA